MMDRLQCLATVYEDVCKQFSLTFDEFVKASADWDIKPLEFNGELAAIVMTFDTEMHIEFCENAAKYGRRIYRHCITEHIEKNGLITTRVWKHDKEAAKVQKFLARLGFRETHNDASFWHYCLMNKGY